MIETLIWMLNMLILASYGWLLRAYWPMQVPPSPWNMLILTMVTGVLSLMAMDVLYLFDVVTLTSYAEIRALVVRAQFAFGGCYAVWWHSRKVVIPPEEGGPAQGLPEDTRHA